MVLNWKYYVNFNHFEQFSSQKSKLKLKYKLFLALCASEIRESREKNAKNEYWASFYMPMYILYLEHFSCNQNDTAKGDNVHDNCSVFFYQNQSI